MSASQHQREAKAQDKEGAVDASEYNPKAVVEREVCGREPPDVFASPCWTSRSNPTDEHLREAKAHWKLAEEHRAASTALLAAEQRACVGISTSDRDESPFVHRADIASVGRLEILDSSGKSPVSKLVGATIIFRHVTGLTKEYLQRTVDCHLARDVSMGFSMPEMAFCPVAVMGARASIVNVAAGLGVEIRADEPDAAKEILKRAQALRSSP